MITTEQTVVTPHGTFVAMWDEDENIPVAYRGNQSAVDYVRSYMALNVVSGRNGAILDLDNLEPADLYGFCQSQEYGIVVIQDPDDVFDEQGIQDPNE
jgi:hypothetical protein